MMSRGVLNLLKIAAFFGGIAFAAGLMIVFGGPDLLEIPAMASIGLSQIFVLAAGVLYCLRM